MTELKPCPFCGKDDKLAMHHRKTRHYDEPLAAVKCRRCGIRGRYQMTDERAVAAWNRRAERTCHVNELDALTQTLSMVDGCSWGECSECGCLTPTDSVFCIRCGARVVD